MNENNMEISWDENVIVVDAEYADRVAFNLTVNFERMLERRIPKADLAKWLDCVALDGGLRPEGERSEPAQVSVVLVHEKSSKEFANFSPSAFSELHEKAFQDSLGEFVISALPVESITTKDDLVCEVAELASQSKQVKRLMVVPNSEDGDCYDQLRHRLRNAPDDKRITLFAMQPMTGGNFRQEILGYSLMQALGIHGDELK